MGYIYWIKFIDVLYLSTLEEVKEWNKELEFLGVVVTMYDCRLSTIMKW